LLNINKGWVKPPHNLKGKKMKKIILHKYRSENVAKFYAEGSNKKYIGWQTGIGVDKFITEDIDGGAYCVEEIIEE
tara:strand:+ start:501 stop:728 length:228 start_codon:yes stop_codon:yes gene_type:complete